MNRKDRKHSGRYTPRLVDKSMKFDEMKEQALEPQQEYDDWIERRDSFRDYQYLEWKKRDKLKDRKKR